MLGLTTLIRGKKITSTKLPSWQQFKDEVLFADFNSTLPCNLNSKWHSALSNCAKNWTEEIDGEDESEPLTFLLSAIMKILMEKDEYDGGAIEFRASELDDYIRKYQTELALEELRRYANVDIEPATIETILTDRSVKYTLPET